MRTRDIASAMKNLAPLLVFSALSTLLALPAFGNGQSSDHQLQCAAELLGAFREITPELRQRIVSAPARRKIFVEILARDAHGQSKVHALLHRASDLGVIATEIDRQTKHLESTGLSAALAGQKSHFSRYYLIGTASALQQTLLAVPTDALPAIFFASSESLTLGQPAFQQKILKAIAQLAPTLQKRILATVTPDAELALKRARSLPGAIVALDLDLSYDDLKAIGAADVEVLNLGQDQSELDPTGFGGPRHDYSGIVVRGEALALDQILHTLLPGARVGLQKSLAREDMSDDSYNRRSLDFFLQQGLSERQILAFLERDYYRWSIREIDYILRLSEQEIAQVKLTGRLSAVFHEELAHAASRSQLQRLNPTGAYIQVLDLGITVPKADEERARVKAGAPRRDLPYEILLRGTRSQIIQSLIELPKHALSLSKPELVIP